MVKKSKTYISFHDDQYAFEIIAKFYDAATQEHPKSAKYAYVVRVPECTAIARRESKDTRVSSQPFFFC